MNNRELGSTLVTGGSGFIGSHFVQALIDSGNQVLNIDITPPKIPAHFDLWVKADIHDRDLLVSVFNEFQPKNVVHMAAKAELESKTLSAYSSIIDGTQNVLDAASLSGAVERFVHTSTQYVVGPGIDPEPYNIYDPYTLYGEAKSISEKIVRSYSGEVDWAVVRPTGIWGPYHPSFSQSTWKYLKSGHYLLPTTREPVYRAYGYVSNTIRQIIALLKSRREDFSGQTYYLADHVIDNSIWVDSFSYALRGAACRRCSPHFLAMLGRSGDLLQRLGIAFPFDSGRAYRLSASYPVPLLRTLDILGAPDTSLEEGVKETVEWLHQEWGLEIE